MPSKPTTKPRWATNPPAAPPTTITEPSEGIKNVGYQPGNPIRQFTNWLFNLGYQWIDWLEASAIQVDDLFEDFIHPSSSKTIPPTPGVGLTNTTGAAVGYVGGFRSVLAAAARTYTATTDTYIDLTQGGGFTATEVGVGDPAPAIPADHLRLWRVRTDGSDVTQVEVLAQQEIRFVEQFHALKSVKLGHNLVNSAAEFLIARAIGRFSATGTDRMLLLELTDVNWPTGLSGGNRGVRLYLLGSGAEPELELVFGASYNEGTSQWDVDPKSGGTVRMSRWRYSVSSGVRYEEVTDTQVGGGSFADAAWSATYMPDQTKLRTFLGGFFAKKDGFTLREQIEVPSFWSTFISTTYRSLAARLGEALNVYALNNSIGLDVGVTGSSGGEWAINARLAWDGVSQFKWYRINASQNAYLYNWTDDGIRIYFRDGTLADEWFNSGWVQIDLTGQNTQTSVSHFGPGVIFAPPGTSDLDQGPGSGGNVLNAPIGVRKGGNVSPSADVMQPIRLPHGATITGATIKFSNSLGAVAADDVRVALVRIDQGNARQSLNSGNYDNVANSPIPFDKALTVDTFDVVDTENYRYYAWVWGNQATTFDVGTVLVNYTVPGNLALWR